MSTHDVDPAIHPKFVDKQHDVVLQATDAVDSKGDVKPSSRFQMRSAALAAMSPVFADMAVLGRTDGEGKLVAPLKLPETAAVLEVVLSFSKDGVDNLPVLPRLSTGTLFGAYQATMKYGMTVPQALLELHIT